MIRLNMIVEGPTEQEFAARILAPHLARFGVQLARPACVVFARKGSQVRSRGGLPKYAVAKDHLVRWLKQERMPDAFFTTMFDLYGLPDDFPGHKEASQLADKYARVEKMEEAFAADVGDGRFLPYLQLHEFEAILFSRPGVFGEYFLNSEREVRELHRIVDTFGNPELIDDGEESSPSHRILRQLPYYQKRTAGPQLADAIGLPAIRDKCQHFSEWVAKLEQLGTSP